jgi:nitrite reductase/ring-hydroxylating ferredoxin subunit
VPDDDLPTTRPMTDGPTTTPSDDCSSCDLHAIAPDRRAFLRDAARAAAAALVLVGARRADALARPLAFAAPLRADGDTVRYPIPAADGATIDREHDVILTRWQGRVYAFSLACPHRNTALRWLAADARFQCPKHKSKYRPDGSFIEGRATRGMDRFAIARDGAAVVVDLAVLHRESDDRSAWSAAVVAVQ